MFHAKKKKMNVRYASQIVVVNNNIEPRRSTLITGEELLLAAPQRADGYSAISTTTPSNYSSRLLWLQSTRSKMRQSHKKNVKRPPLQLATTTTQEPILTRKEYGRACRRIRCMQQTNNPVGRQY
uniref:Uncharacterized protein n=1 Tax=Physcomitrium patens TaxID=3218 RepID=A0A2K1IZI1_PHYPA|nr:hypothetical protein PHYPA_022585 [Physcomitrium patens]